MSKDNNFMPVRPVSSSSGPSIGTRGSTSLRETEGDSVRKIHVNVAGPDGILLTYFVPVKIQMKEIPKRFCQDGVFEYMAMEFFDHAGRRVQLRSTPEELHMEDGDMIDAFVRSHSKDMSEDNNFMPVRSVSLSSGPSIGTRGSTSLRETEGDSVRKIHVNVAGPDGILLTYFVPVKIQMKEILKRFCQDGVFEYMAMEFFDHAGRRVQLRSTPEELHMEDGDMIDAFVRSHSKDMSEDNNFMPVRPVSLSSGPSIGTRGSTSLRETEGDSVRKIHVNVAGPDGILLTYFVPVKIQMKEILKRFCQDGVFEYMAMEFFDHAGRPEELHMEDGDMIDAFVRSHSKDMSEDNNFMPVRPVSLSSGPSIGTRGSTSLRETEGDSVRKIHVNVAGPDGILLTYFVPVKIQMKEILKRLCQDGVFEYMAMEFFDHAGRQVQLRSTPEELHMEDGDMIDAFVRSHSKDMYEDNNFMPVRPVSLSSGPSIGTRGSTSLRETEGDSVRKIHVNVAGPDGILLTYFVPVKIQMKEILKRFCQDGVFEYMAMEFFDHAGRRVQLRSTPEELHMEDGDMIDAFVRSHSKDMSEDNNFMPVRPVSLSSGPSIGTRGSTSLRETEGDSVRKIHVNVAGPIQMKEILKRFCQDGVFEYMAMEFFDHAGRRVQLRSTPEELHMEDGDMIDAFVRSLSRDMSEDNNFMPVRPVSLSSGPSIGMRGSTSLRETEGDSVRKIHVNVAGPDGILLTYFVPVKIQMKEILKRFCQDGVFEYMAMEFFDHAGRRVQLRSTPEELHMEDGDMIDAFVRSHSKDMSEDNNFMPVRPVSLSSGPSIGTRGSTSLRETEGDSVRKIHVNVAGPDGILLTYFVPVKIQMKEILKRFCQDGVFEYMAMEFFDHAGRRVQLRSTLEELHMEDGDMIDAFVRSHSKDMSEDNNFMPVRPVSLSSGPSIGTRGSTSLRETEGDSVRKIHVNVAGPDGILLTYFVPVKIQMKEILKRFCQDGVFEYMAMEFFDNAGRRVQLRSTPEELHMEDGDMIDAFVRSHSKDMSEDNNFMPVRPVSLSSGPSIGTRGSTSLRETEGDSVRKIHVNVAGPDGILLTYFVPVKIQMKEILKRFCQDGVFEYMAMEFFDHAGRRVQLRSTPEELHMEDGDMIDAFVRSHSKDMSEDNNFMPVRPVSLSSGPSIGTRGSTSLRETEGDSVRKIHVNVAGPDGILLTYFVPVKIQMKEILKRFCQDGVFEYMAMEFFDHAGRRVQLRSTPEELHMEDGDMIDAFVRSHSKDMSEDNNFMPVRPVSLSSGPSIGTRGSTSLRETEGDSVRKIHVNVAGPDGILLTYFVPVKIQMKEILKRFCQDGVFEYMAMEFFDHAGRRVQLRSTPEELHMEDGDMIDAFVRSHSKDMSEDNNFMPVRPVSLSSGPSIGTRGSTSLRETEGDSVRKIHVNVAGPDGILLTYFVPVKIQMKEILKRFCQDGVFEYMAMEFFDHAGRRVQLRSTPEELHMEDGDMIDAFVRSLSKDMSEDNNFMPVRPVSLSSGPSIGTRGSTSLRETEGDSVRKIHVNVAGPDGILLTYFVPVKIQMKEILKRFCQDGVFEYMAMEFFDHAGRRVQLRSTPEELHMEDGDMIDAFVFSHSG